MKPPCQASGSLWHVSTLTPMMPVGTVSLPLVTFLQSMIPIPRAMLPGGQVPLDPDISQKWRSDDLMGRLVGLTCQSIRVLFLELHPGSKTWGAASCISRRICSVLMNHPLPLEKLTNELFAVSLWGLSFLTHEFLLQPMFASWQ